MGEVLGYGSVVFAQIRWLISNLNRKNQKATVSELHNLLGAYGESAFAFTVRCLVEEVDFRAAAQAALKVQLLAQEFAKLVTRPNATSLIGDAIGGASLAAAAPLTEEWLALFAKAVRATVAQQLALGLAIAQLSDEEKAAEGDKFLRARLAELTRAAAGALPDALAHALLYFLGDPADKARAALVRLLQAVHPEENAPLTLLPLLYSGVGGEQAAAAADPSDLDSRLSYQDGRGPPPSDAVPALAADATELAELMRDLGYSCCASRAAVVELVSQLTGADGALPGAEGSVAAAICMMASTAASLDDSLSLHGPFSTAVSGKYLEFDAKFDEDSAADAQALTAWGVEAFVGGVSEALPSLRWGGVFEALDQPTWAANGPGADGFALLVALHRRACSGPLPAGALLGGWTHAGAQLRLLAHAVGAAADAVAWGDAAAPLVSPAPDGTSKPGIAPWLSLRLTESLLHLSASGYHAEARALFAAPLSAAPQLLLAALLTHSGARAGAADEAPLQRELLDGLFPLFLGGDSPGSAALLQRLWEAQPYAVMRGMAALHRAQPQSILRLLDLATSFNALEKVLTLGAYSFTIDLAACAQRKELIDFEPWLHSCLRRDPEHAFVRACASYLREKLLPGSATNLARAAATSNVNVLSVDAAAIIFRVLTSLTPTLPPTLAADLHDLHTQCVHAKPKLGALLAGSGGAAASASDSKPPGIGLGAANPAAPSAAADGAAENGAPASEATVTLSLAYESAVASRAAFDAAFRQDVAASLGVGESAVAVIAVSAGSTVVDFSAAGAGDVAGRLRDSGFTTPHLTRFNGGAPVAATAITSRGAGGAPSAAAPAPADAGSLDFGPGMSLPAGLTDEPAAGAPAGGAAAGAPLPGMPGGEATSFPPEIEEIANSYFQKIYSDAASIDEIIGVLKAFQAAPAQSREQKVYVCMVHNLFDEYKYFPKYPDKPLRTTAVLFGALVQHGLVSHITLGLFLRYVLEALKKPPLSKMSKFGITALEQFKPRLAEWPQYCQLLLAIPQLPQLAPELPLFLEAQLAATGAVASAPPPLADPSPAAALGTPVDVSGPPVAEVAPAPGALAGLAGALGLGAAPAASAPASALPAALQPGAGAAAPQSALQVNSPVFGPASGTPPAPAAAAAAELPAVSMGSLGVGGFGREGCIETLMSSTSSAEVAPPPDAVQDRIGFVLNNMGQGNLPAKAAELMEAIESHDSSVPWFANYLVVRRVALEPNFHTLYAAMLHELSLPPLYRAILEATLQNARVLLSSQKIRSSSSERSLLKNLGSWLGSITLGRNKPLLMKDIDLKELVCDAYENGRLIAVVPFVAKVLDACSTSRVFLPPNPWVMALMSLLMELYQVPDLKLNLKFEIEVLAKTLKVELADISPTRTLCHRQQDRAQTCDFANRAGPAALNAPGGGGFGGFSGSAPAFSLPGTDGPLPSAPAAFGSQLQPQGLQQPPPPPPPQPGMGGFGAAPSAAAQYSGPPGFFQQQQAQQQAQQAQQQAQAQQQQQAQQQAAAQAAQQQAQQQQQAQAQQQQQQALGAQGGGAAALAALGAAADADTVIPNLASYVQINPALFSQQPQLKRVVPLALDRAIREIISPVVERSVTISCVTTRELMLKDFAMEPDEMRMRKAAQLMVSNLAGSLALVTCKEPLRVACSNHMRALLQQAGSLDVQLMEQLVQVCSSDNLDLGCTLIEKAATEKAVRDVEEALAPAFAIRRKHREQTGLPYYDMSIFTSGRYPTGLPEALRPKPGGLLPTQRRVYEDFGRIPRGVAAAAPPPQQQAGIPGIGAAATGPAQPPQPPQPPQGAAGQFGGLGGLSGDGGGGGSGGALALGRAPQASGAGSLPGLGSAAAGMPPGFPAAGAQHGVGMLPGSAPAQAGGGVGGAASGALSQAEALERLSLILAQLDLHVSQLAPQGVGMGALPASHEVHALLARVAECVTYCASRDEVALAMAGNVFKRMYEQAANAGAAARLATQINVSVLARVGSACKKVSAFVADMLLYAGDDERKLHEEIVLSLLLAQVVAMTTLSPRLAKHLTTSRSPHAVAFSAWLVRRTMLDEPLVAATDAKELLGALAALAQQPNPPEGLLRLLDDLRTALAQGGAQGGRLPKPPPPAAVAAAPAAAAPPPAAAAAAPRRLPPAEPPDAALSHAREQLAPLWAEWLSLCGQQGANERGFVSQLQAAGWLRQDEQGERFLRVTTELAIAAAHADGSADGGTRLPLAFGPLDAYSKLVVLILKSLTPEPTPSGARDTTPAATAATARAQLAALVRVLSAVVAHLARSHAHHACGAHHHEPPPGAPPTPPFNQRAYLRLFGNWLLELAAPDPALDTLQPQMLYAFAAAFEALRPSRVPGFAFAWLELVSHRSFMPKLLLAPGRKGWPRLQKLLGHLFSFLYPNLTAPRLSPPTKHLYRGALRVLLVLLHDFPEFLCDYHLALCDAIPHTCVQLRNLVLSAFPRHMMLPDPFTPNLKVDLLPESSQPPTVLSPYTAALSAAGILEPLDAFLKGRGPRSLLQDLRQRLVGPDGAHRVAAIHALVLRVGVHAISHGLAAPSSLAHSAPMEVLSFLAGELGPEGRYLLLNGLANQLRYPNNHTHYFSCVLLYLFSEARDEPLQEQITRVLVERLIVHRPHPWGLLITFIELIKNPRYEFWAKNFTRCAPEIERLFESVARSCMAGAAPTPGGSSEAVA